MKKYNLPLIIGSLIVAFIVVVMIVPEAFTDKSPYTIKQIKFIHEDGKLDVESAPFKPSDEAIMGSDDLGRDIYSLIIYGTKLTISLGILIALAHFIIAVPLAMVAGFGNGFARNMITQSNIIFSAIPGLLINVILLRLAFFIGLDKSRSILAFVIIITLTGWPKLATLISERVEAILDKPFITGEIAVGKSRGAIAIQNVFPHLVPELIVLFFMEIARSLSMIMQLGLFSVFIGNLRIIKSSDFANIIYYDVSFEPEWASMLSSSRTMISVAPWTVIYPALAFFISVLGFNLLGEGIRELVQKKNSKIIPHTRQLMSLNAGYFINRIRKKTGRQLIVIPLLIFLTIFLTVILGEDYKIKAQTDLTDYKDQVMIGSQESQKLATYIASEMEALGMEALEDDFLVEYEVSEGALIQSSDLELVIEGARFPLDLSNDYSIETAHDGSFEGGIVDLTGLDLYDLYHDWTFNDGTDYESWVEHRSQNSSIQELDKAFVLIDSRLYNDRFLDSFMKYMGRYAKPEGFIYIRDRSNLKEKKVLDRVDDVMVVNISEDIGIRLKDNPNALLRGSVSIRRLGSQGRDVLGIYRGSDPYIQEEAIVIGMGYNYLNQEGKEALTSQLDLMKSLCGEKNKRSLIFVFCDGTYSDASHGIHILAQDFPYSSTKIKAYIDMTGISNQTFTELTFSTKQAPITRQFAWSIGHYLTQELEKEGIKTIEADMVNNGGEYFFTEAYWMNTMFWDRGIATIHLSVQEENHLMTSDSRKNQPYNLGQVNEILLKVISMSNY